jgi:hypothetical protein
MELADIQAEVMRRHGVRVPLTDPSFVVASMNEMMLAVHAARIEAAAVRIEAVKSPIAEQDLDRLAKAAARRSERAAMALARSANWRTILLSAGVLAAVALTGVGAGYWMHGDGPALAGVHAGAERCSDHPNGGRLCWIPVWERLPPAQRD